MTMQIVILPYMSFYQISVKFRVAKSMRFVLINKCFEFSYSMLCIKRKPIEVLEAKLKFNNIILIRP